MIFVINLGLTKCLSDGKSTYFIGFLL